MTNSIHLMNSMIVVAIVYIGKLPKMFLLYSRVTRSTRLPHTSMHNATNTNIVVKFLLDIYDCIFKIKAASPWVS